MTAVLPAAPRPEPVLDAAKVAAAVSGTVLSIGAAFVLVGWATADEVRNWATIAGGIVVAVGTLIAVVMPIITAYGARAQVTPLANPVSVEGAPLTMVPAGSAAAPETRELVDELRDLERSDQTRPIFPLTTPLQQVGPWTPATPAVLAAEPTPIEAQAAAAAGRSNITASTT